MQRDPKEKLKADYFKRIKYRTVHPILFWYQCDKCGKEFAREKMYKFNNPVVKDDFILEPLFDINIYGCTHCFDDLDNFKDYCKKYIRFRS